MAPRVFLACVCAAALLATAVRAQCTAGAKPVMFVDADEACGDSSGVDGYDVYCKNFLACRADGANRTCQESDNASKEQFADFPYNETCAGNDDCPAPLICAVGVCDYVASLVNGYQCERSSQCASMRCVFVDDATTGECAPTHNDTSGVCAEDVDCPVGEYCDVSANVCADSLKEGEDCTGYDLPSMPSSVCQPGLVCLPANDTLAECQKPFSFEEDDYCGTNPFACGTGLFCNVTCTAYPTVGTEQSNCDSLAPEVCPEGYACSCIGNDEQTSTCKKFANSECSRSLQKYLDCMGDKDCYFDPWTLVNNPGNTVPQFLGPLNRFSCAAVNCMKEYDSVVKCQNYGFKSSETFSPARTPEWATYYDAVLKGWQVALIVVASGVGILCIVSVVILLSSESSKSEYETVE